MDIEAMDIHNEANNFVEYAHPLGGQRNTTTVDGKKINKLNMKIFTHGKYAMVQEKILFIPLTEEEQSVRQAHLEEKNRNNKIG
jgi:hypothetical protein